MKIKSLLAVGAVIFAIALSACTKMNSVEETTNKNAEAISELNEKINQYEVKQNEIIDSVFNCIHRDSVAIENIIKRDKIDSIAIDSLFTQIDSIKIHFCVIDSLINTRNVQLDSLYSKTNDRLFDIENYIATKNIDKDNFFKWLVNK